MCVIGDVGRSEDRKSLAMGDCGVDTIRFLVELRHDLGREILDVMPEINGAPLADMVESFEKQVGFDDPAGGYGGLVPSFYRFGPLNQHFKATGAAHLVDSNVPVLGCECGECGCWPLLATVTVGDDRVTWSGFSQPHRTGRDYSEFGPFEFDRQEYDTALADLVHELESRASAD